MVKKAAKIYCTYLSLAASHFFSVLKAAFSRSKLPVQRLFSNDGLKKCPNRTVSLLATENGKIQYVFIYIYYNGISGLIYVLSL
jgi:hypothetical protein